MDWKIKILNPVLWSLGWKEFLQATIVIVVSEKSKNLRILMYFSLHVTEEFV